MRVCGSNFLKQLTDTSAIDANIKIRVTRDNVTVIDNLPVESWDYSEELDQQVKASFTCTVADDSGELIPYELTDILAPGGGRLVIDYALGGETLRLGEFVITQSAPELMLVFDGSLVKARAGKIKLDCKDLLELYSADRFIAPVKSDSSNNIAGEISRLARGRQVDALPGVDSRRTAPAGVVYDRDRLKTLEDLAKRVDGFLRVSPGGALELAPLNPPENTEVVSIVGGDGGCLVNYVQSFDLDKIYNAVIASNNEEENSTDGGERFVGTAFESLTESRLGWGGAIGYRPMFYASDLIKSQTQANDAAASRLATHRANRVIELEVTCLPDPRLQVGDPVALPLLGTGADVSQKAFRGKVTSLGFSGTAGGVGEMKLKVEVPATAFAQALKQLKDSTGQGVF